MTLRNMFRYLIFPVLYSQTTVAPNGWAAVSLWRRFFQLQEDEKDEMMDAVACALEGIDERQVRPIACEDVKVAREEFIRESYRSMVGPTTPSIRVLDTAATSQDHHTRAQLGEVQQLSRPNLQVPVSSAGMPDSAYLAQ
jgi:hypothetical protein